MSPAQIRKSFRRYLLIGVATVAISVAMPMTAHAQYRELKAEKPNVEVDMDALAREKSAAPANPLQGSRPAWQKPREPDTPSNTAPVILRRPAPLAEPMPALAPARQAAPDVPARQTQETAQQAPAATAAEPPPAAAAPARVLKPLFAAPVVPPAGMAPVVRAEQETPAPKSPAAQHSAADDMPRTASQKTDDVPPPALVRPVREILPETRQPAAKPARITMPISQERHPALPAAGKEDQAQTETRTAPPAATTQTAQPAAAAKPRREPLSYPPAETPRSAGRPPVLERPVLPSGLRRDEYAPVIPRSAVTSAKDVAAPITEAPVSETPVNEIPAAGIAAGILAPVAPAATASVPETVPAESFPAPITETVRNLPVETAPAVTAAEETPEPDVLPLRKPAKAAAAPAIQQADTAPVYTPVKKPAVKTPKPAASVTRGEMPANRPSLVVIEDMPAAPAIPVSAETQTAPESQTDTQTAATALPAPKPMENIPPPLTEPQLVQIGKNIETIPARVAIAPPRLEPQDIEVPTLADLTLEFDGTSSDLNAPTRQKLINIIPHLKQEGERRLAVHAYASGEDGSKSSARRISLSRALAVRAFLMDNGVQPTRVDVRALGLETDRKPLERVDLVFAR